MNYLSCAEAAKARGTTVRRIQQMCKRGEIPGAIKKGHSWMIPENAVVMNRSEKKKPLPIGISDFKTATTDYCYVDKTLLIRDFLDSKPCHRYDTISVTKSQANGCGSRNFV